MKPTLKKLAHTALRKAGVVPGAEARLASSLSRIAGMEQRALVLHGQTLEATRAATPALPLEKAEFSVFSQFGEDGIIAHLVDSLPGIPQTFVEFGVESYEEANTRYLLVTRGWRGLVMDGSDSNVARIQADNVCWRHGLTAVSAFITRDNIAQLLKKHGPRGPLGLLSTDIDGNDYWVSQALMDFRPWIVVAEYNGIMGRELPLSIPYQADFRRGSAHNSHIHWGCSLRAIAGLWQERGYALVYCNTAGNNAFFVDSKRLPAHVKTRSVDEAFRFPKFREARDATGQLTLRSSLEMAKTLPDALWLENVVNGEHVTWRQVAAAVELEGHE